MNRGNTILIEKYIKGELNEADHLAFEKSISTDRGLAREVAEMKLLINGIRYSQMQKNLHRLKNLENQLVAKDQQNIPGSISTQQQGDKTKKTTPGKVILAIGTIAAILLFGLFLKFIIPLKVNPNTQLAMQFHENMIHAYIIRSNQSTALINEAYSNYDAQNYKKAIPLLEELATLYPESDHQLHLGVALIGNQQPGAALQALYKASEQLPNYQDAIHFYKALAFLQLDQIEDCKKELSQISSDQKWVHKGGDLLNAIK